MSPSPSPPSLRAHLQKRQHTTSPLPNSISGAGQPQDGGNSKVIHTQPDWSGMNMLNSEFEFRGNDSSFFQNRNTHHPTQDLVQSHPSVKYPGIDQTHNHPSCFYQGMNLMAIDQSSMASNINNFGYTVSPGSLTIQYNQPQYYTQVYTYQPGNPGYPVIGSMDDQNNRNDGQGGYPQQRLQAQAPGHANFALPQRSLPHITTTPNQEFRRTDNANSPQADSARTQRKDSVKRASSPEPHSFESFRISLPHEDIFAMPQNPNRVAPAFTLNPPLFYDPRRRPKKSGPSKKTRRPRAKLASDPFASEQGHEGSEQVAQGDSADQVQELGETQSGAGSGNDYGISMNTLPTDEDIEAMNAVTDEDLRLAREAMGGPDWA